MDAEEFSILRRGRNCWRVEPAGRLALMRVGSSNLNNRSLGFDTVCDLAVQAPPSGAGAATRAAIRRRAAGGPRRPGRLPGPAARVRRLTRAPGRGSQSRLQEQPSSALDGKSLITLASRKSAGTAEGTRQG
jgi:hypothetical protein